MIVVLALVFAITLVLAFLCLGLGYLQQPPEDRRMSRCPDLPWLVGDTPKYVPPQEVAEQYDSYVRQLNEEGRTAQVHSVVGSAGISKDATGDPEHRGVKDLSKINTGTERSLLPATPPGAIGPGTPGRRVRLPSPRVFSRTRSESAIPQSISRDRWCIFQDQNLSVVAIGG